MASSIFVKLSISRLSPAVLFSQPVRTTINKHYDPKFKKQRKEKFMKVDLPDFNEEHGTMSKEKIRQKMKERGILPPRQWIERPFYISATDLTQAKKTINLLCTVYSHVYSIYHLAGGVFEPYVPPEGDGKASLVSPTRAKQAVQHLEKKSKSMMAIRKVKSFDEDFSSSDFCQKAQDIYIKAHQSLVNLDRKELRMYVTEKAYPEFWHNTQLKTIRWKFLESLEPPRIVHARCTNVVSKDNIFGQITMRFHTRQQLAVYDRFGRLLHGSEILAKDVLEYIVFEKHLSNLYGTWRIHEKIIPDWMPPKEPSKLTRRVPTAVVETKDVVPATEPKTEEVAEK